MRYDVAILGLGTAGAAAARACARAGLRVIALDRAPLDSAGAAWVNGVPAWAFDEAGVPRPAGLELLGADAPFHLVAGWAGPRVTVRGFLEVDMRLLAARLRRDAEEAGAALRGGARVRGVEGDAVRCDGEDVVADVIVDASGLGAVNLLGAPAVPAVDLCAAVQEVRHVADRRGALDWLAANEAAEGDVLCFSGVAGGYSIVNVRVHGEEVSILTGSIPALGHASGRHLRDAFVAENPWVGEKAFGGGRAIPLGRPVPVIGRERHAAIGDAAGQVHPAHGSGIAQQLLAARDLAEALAGGGGPAAYNVRWQRRRGGVLAAADVFRRFSQTLTLDDLSALMAAGVLSPPMMVDVMQQRPSRPPPLALARALPGLARERRLLRAVLPVVGRMRAVEALYRAYPARPGRVGRWARAVARAAGDPNSNA